MTKDGKKDMSGEREAIIFLMRCPEYGKVKTRLAGAIGPREALDVYVRLLRRTAGVLADLKKLRPRVGLFLFFTPPEEREAALRYCPASWIPVPQHGEHLGDRMGNAFSHVWEQGYRHAVMVGSDIADVAASDLEEAFEALLRADAVLGPAADGGFYLIGLKKPCPPVFQYPTWGVGDVFCRTRDLLADAGLLVRFAGKRNDIDRIEDLEQHVRQNPVFASRLTVIVPTLSTPDLLRPLLDTLEAGLWPGDDILVVQGSERPETNGNPEWIGPRMRRLYSPKGRGIQLNRGVREATGELLWFLHDDSLVPPHFAYHVRKLLLEPDAGLGCFRLGFCPSTPLLDAIAHWANLRTRYLKLPYGDQGLFCRRETVAAAGGFRRPFLMEDVDFVREAGKLGKIMLLPEVIHTSSKRYTEKGVLRTSLQNHFAMLLYRFGVNDRKIYSLYYGRGG